MKSETWNDHDIDVHGAASGNVKTRCPKCSTRRSKPGDPCLSVNVGEGVWKCHHCGWSGKLRDDRPELAPVTRPAPENPALQPLTPDAAKWLEERGISRATADRYGVQSALVWYPQSGGREPSVGMPFIRDGLTVNVKYRSIASKAFSQWRGGEQIAYNRDGVEGAGTIIITEGELDALALAEVGFCNATSCPNGAPAVGTKNLETKLRWIEEARSIFDGASKIILAGDNDAPGVAWMDAIAAEVGPGKCCKVTWSTECKDAGDVLRVHGRGVLRECIEGAAPVPVPGITHMAEHRQEILEYWRNGGASRGLSTGWKSVDALCRINPIGLHVVTGIPGSGKSEWMDQVILNTIRDHKWRWVVFSPENYPITFHFQKLAEKLVRKPMFATYSTPALNQAEIETAIDVLDGALHFLTFGEETATLDSVLNRAKSCVERGVVNAILIDPYNELDHSRPYDMSETEYISQFLSRLRNFGRLSNVAVWVVAHPAKPRKDEKTGRYPVPTPYDISGSAHWRNKADVCIAVHREASEDADTRNTVQIHVQKVRNKNHGQIGAANLYWQRETGVFFESKADMAKQAAGEPQTVIAPEDWPEPQPALEQETG